MSDEYVIETNGRYRVVLIPDLAPENPRIHYDHECHVVSVPDRNYIGPDDKDGGPLAHVWRHLTRNGERWPMRDAVEQFQRTVSILGGWSLYDSPHDGPSCVWYLLPGSEIANGHEMEALKSERDEWRQWCEGDVWGWRIEESIGYARADGKVGGHSHWEEIPDDGSCWGFYGYDYAVEEAEREFAAFLDRQAV